MFIPIEEIDYITESKRFCLESCMDPKEIPLPQAILSAEELEQKREEYDEILSVVKFFGSKVLDSLKGTPLLLSVSDENGFILHMMGDETIKNTVNQLGIRSGIQFTEEAMGTNVVNLSLKYSGMPIQLIGNDHYHEYLHQTACYAVAFSYAGFNTLLGSIIIMTAIEYQNPLMITMLSTTVDSIERELLLRKQNRKLDIMNQIIMDNTRNGIIITDKAGNITGFNEFGRALTGLTKTDILGESILPFEPLGEYIHDVIHYAKRFENIQVFFDAHKIVCLLDALPIYDEHKQLIGAFGQFRNITERYEAEERYNSLANHDELTGLPNRRYYNTHASHLLEQAVLTQSTSKLAVMYLDLDRFKLVNDTLGHTQGDYLLQAVARRLILALGPDDIVARMGGDEFMFLFSHIDDDRQVIEKAENISALFKEPFQMDEYKFHITASMGIALFPDDGLDLKQLMIHADTAMYKAKHSGKNNYMVYSADMNTQSPEKIKLESSIRQALENDEFQLYYQPQVNIKTGEITGVEALTRWNHPERGVISPIHFIPLAEEIGFIDQIDMWALRKACEQNRQWRDSGLPPLRVAVNLSSKQFSKPYLVEIVEGILEETGLEPQFLDLEITETMTMDVDHTIHTLKRLHHLGIQISIDDFGIGYSSLNYLKNFSIDRLKIDQSFVRDILTDSNDSNIVGTIIAMAHTLGLEVIAEGVEEKDQLRFLQFQKCDEVQGYYFSKPIPAMEFEKNFKALQASVKKNY